MKKIFSILATIILLGLNAPIVLSAIYNVTNCSSIPTPAEGEDFCFEGSTNTLKKYSGGNWVDMVGAGYNRIQEEGGNLAQESILNFIGSGVTCAAVSGKTNCTFTGGSGSQHKVNGTDVTTNDPINFRTTATIQTTNPSAGNIDLNVVANSIGNSQIADAALSAAKISGTAVVQSRTISTTSPLSGGGDLSTNRTIAFSNQTANTILSGPTSGGSAAPTFRALVDADIPAAIARDSEINVQGTTNEITSTGSGAAPTLSIASTFRLGGKTHTAPATVGNTLPATCALGDMHFDSDAPAGQNIYGCTATDTWTLQAGGETTSLTANSVSSIMFCNDQGSTDAYACSLSPAITAYDLGYHYWFRANTANTGAATLQLNGIVGAKTIKKVVGGITTDLENNDIRAGQIVEVVYDNTNFQMVSQLGNAATGVSGLTTGTIPKAASSTQLENSSIAEDSDSINIAKKLEVGNVSTNSWEILGSNVTGHKTYELPNISSATVGVTTGTLTNGNCLRSSSGALVDAGFSCVGGILYVPLVERGAVTIALEGIVSNQPKDYWATVTDADTDALDFHFPITASMASMTTITVRLIGVSKAASPSGNVLFTCAAKAVRPGTDTYAAHSTTGQQNVTLTPATQNRPVGATSSAITLNGTVASGGEVEGSCEVDAAGTTSTQLTDFRAKAFAVITWQ